MYQHGPKLYFPKDITETEITEIFEKLKNVFGDNIRTYESVMSNDDHFFDINGNGYKSFRINKGDSSEKYTLSKSYIQKKPNVKFPRYGTKWTCLKAFNNAPPWTYDEVNAVLGILGEYGVLSSTYKLKPIKNT